MAEIKDMEALLKVVENLKTAVAGVNSEIESLGKKLSHAVGDVRGAAGGQLAGQLASGSQVFAAVSAGTKPGMKSQADMAVTPEEVTAKKEPKKAAKGEKPSASSETLPSQTAQGRLKETIDAANDAAKNRRGYGLAFTPGAKARKENTQAGGELGRALMDDSLEGSNLGRLDKMLAGRRAAGRAKRMAKYGMMTGDEIASAFADPENSSFQTPMFGPSDIIGLLKNSSNALSAFLPSVPEAMAQTSSYYSATLYGGNQRTRGDTTRATLDTLSNLSGISSPGADARVAEYLASSGLPLSTLSGSTYQQTLRTVANAARYMNISNEAAVQSVEGLTNATGAANTLRQLGIYTADLTTGKEKTQAQIFDEIAQRLEAGRGKATVEQTQMSIRRGALGNDINTLFGNDTTTATMFKQFMLERAAGRTMDLSSENPASGPGYNLNPLQPSLDLASKQSKALATSSENYVAGVQAATAALMGLTDASGALAQVLGGGAAMVQTLFGNQQTKGLIEGLSSILDFTTKGLGTIQTDINGINPVNAIPVGAAIAATSGLMLGGLGATLGAGLLANGASAASRGIEGSASNTTGFFNWSSITSPRGGDSPSSASLLSGYNTALAGSSGSSGTSSVTSTSGGGGGYLFDLSWLDNYRVTEILGSYEGAHPSGGHDGTDYAMAEGTEVKAVADGTVLAARDNNASSGLGYFVMLLHTASDGTEYNSVYGHLSAVLVKDGQSVSRGQVIGRSGNTGDSTGPHLHFEINRGRTRVGGAYSSERNVQLSDAKRILGNGSSSSGSSALESAAVTAAGEAQKLNQIPAGAMNAYGILQKLYSGNPAQISSAIAGLAQGVKIPQSVIAQYMNSKNPASVTAGAGINYGAPGGRPSGGNQVNITVSVPDVTSSEAMKFAQLVKGYLESDSLISNTGNS